MGGARHIVREDGAMEPFKYFPKGVNPPYGGEYFAAAMDSHYGYTITNTWPKPASACGGPKRICCSRGAYIIDIGSADSSALEVCRGMW